MDKMNFQNGLQYIKRAPHFIGYVETRREPMSLLKGTMGEFFGTTFLVFVWTGVALSMGQSNFESKVALSVCIGFAVASMVALCEHVSGGHLNPAVTLGFFASGQINALKAISFIIVQILGGIVGCALLLGLGPRSESEFKSLATTAHNYTFNLTAIRPLSDITVYQTLGIEFLSSVILVLVYLAVQDENRPDFRGYGPMYIGASASACHLAFINYGGIAMNPARCFGAAVVSGIWEYHWIYWVGPLVASLVSAALYWAIFKAGDPSVVINDQNLEIVGGGGGGAQPPIHLEDIAVEIKTDDHQVQSNIPVTTHTTTTITTTTASVSEETPVVEAHTIISLTEGVAEIQIPITSEEEKEKTEPTKEKSDTTPTEKTETNENANNVIENDNENQNEKDKEVGKEKETEKEIEKEEAK